MLDFFYNTMMQFFGTLSDHTDYIVFLTAFVVFVFLLKWLSNYCWSRHV